MNAVCTPKERRGGILNFIRFGSIVLWMLIMSGCSVGNIEVHLFEDGSMKMDLVAGVSKQDVSVKQFEGYLQNIQYVQSPIHNPDFFQDEWGGETKEIWEKQKNGENVFLKRLAEETKYGDDITRNMAFGLWAFREIGTELGFEVALYQDEEKIGYALRKQFKNLDEMKKFVGSLETSLQAYFEEIYLPGEEPFIQNYTKASALILKSIVDAMVNNEESFILEVENAPSKLGVEALKDAWKSLLDLDVYPKDLTDKMGLALKMNLYNPAKSQNAAKASVDNKQLEWDLWNILQINIQMPKEVVLPKKPQSAASSILTMVVFLLIVLAAFVFWDTKKNPENGVLSKFKKTKW